MKRCLIVAFILVSLVAFSSQASTKEEEHRIISCMQNAGFTKLTGIVLDLYHGKINFQNFITKLLEFSSNINFDYIKCVTGNYSNKQDALFNQFFTKLGYSLLYAVNCEKDVGPALIMLDYVIENLQNIKTEWKTALVNSVSLGLVGYQSYNDCKSSFEAIKELWTDSK